jgi:hypothetical protein
MEVIMVQDIVLAGGNEAFLFDNEIGLFHICVFDCLKDIIIYTSVRRSWKYSYFTDISLKNT